MLRARYGNIKGRCVVYLGRDMDTEDDIDYHNVENYLKKLPEIVLESGLENNVSDVK